MHRRPTTLLADSIRSLGRWTLAALIAAGEVSVLLVEATTALIRQPQRRRTIVAQLYHIGYLSLPVVVVAGLAIGLVLAVQGYTTLRRFAAETAVGSMVASSMVTQLAPVTTALMIAGRVGSAIAAELGAMKISEQIDALRIMGTDPTAYLVAPRLLACVALMPFLTAIAAWVGIMGTAGLCLQVWHIDTGAFWAHIRDILWGWDVWTTLVKSSLFGATIALVSCRAGLRTEGGATGVGNACTEGVVVSSLLVLVLNFVFTVVSDRCWSAIYME